jgi:N-acetylglucosaminyl-diphospho-decaprenol L-rhamnosyltransferase
MVFTADACDVAAIVVAHNAAQQLPHCIQSLREQSGSARIALVVVDSGSSDETARVAQELGALVVTADNVGYGAGNNVGRQAAPAARYLLLLNPDAVLLSGRLDELIANADAHPEIGAFAPRIVDTRGQTASSLGTFEHPARSLLDRLAGRSIVHRYTEVSDTRPFDWAQGCALFLRTECFDQVGGFDERYFLYSEERDLLRATKNAGWVHHTYPGLTILHESEGRVPDIKLFVQRFRADLYYARKWHGVLGTLATRLSLALELVRRLTLVERDEWAPSYRAALRALLTERVHKDPVTARQTQARRVLTERQPVS